MPTDTLTLFRKFFNSSIRRESLETRFVFIGLLAMRNDQGIVEATPDAIAAYVNMCPQAVWTALTRLSEPDPDSTTPDEDGRRIVSLGTNRWRLVTHDLYAKRAAEERATIDELALEEDAISKRREQFRLSKQRARAAKRAVAKTPNGASVTDSASPSDVDSPQDLLTHVDIVDVVDTGEDGPVESRESSKLEPKSKAKSLDTGGRRRARIYTAEDVEMRLAQHLFGWIRKNNSRSKEPNLQAWADTFDKMLRIDKREVDEVRAVIKYTQTEPFWMKNALSPDTIRKHYDALTMRMGGKRETGSGDSESKPRTTRFAEWDNSR